MNRITRLFWLLVLGAALSASANSSIQTSRKAYLDQETAGVTEISAHELNNLLENAIDQIILLDVRTFYERSRTNTIDTSREIHIPRGFLEIKAWDSLPLNTTIVVYCSKGIRSKLAARTLQDMGWSKVSSLKGGIQAWYALQEQECGCLLESQEIPDQSTTGD